MGDRIAEVDGAGAHQEAEEHSEGTGAAGADVGIWS